MDDVLVLCLKALADKNRLKILRLLLSHSYCVKALSCQLEISQAAVSQHLQVLRKAGLVKGEKIGYWTHYSVEKQLLDTIGEAVKNISALPPCHKCGNLDGDKCC